MFFEVPVIALFTKFDALDNKAYRTLIKENISRKDARSQAPTYAVVDFEKLHLKSVYGMQYPPKSHVYLRGKLFLLYIYCFNEIQCL